MSKQYTAAGLLTVLVLFGLVSCSNVFSPQEIRSERGDEADSDPIRVTGVSLNESTKTLVVGSNFTLAASIEPEDADNTRVTWKSSDSDVATVASDGVVTAVAVGETTITVTTDDGGHTATATVTVVAETVAITGVAIDTPNSELAAGESLQLDYTLSPTDTTQTGVVWESSDETVATVSDSGAVTAVAGGTTTITLTSVADASLTDTVDITVVVPATGVSLTQSSTTMEVGNSFTFYATVSPTDATNQAVTWQSSDTGVATVDASGMVTAVAVGDTTITVTTDDGGFSDQATVTVVADSVAITGLSIDPPNSDLAAGDSLQLAYSFTPTNTTEQEINWSSDDPDIADVDAGGRVTAVAPGTAVITATSAANGTIFDTVTIDVAPLTVTFTVNEPSVPAVDFTLTGTFTGHPDTNDLVIVQPETVDITAALAVGEDGTLTVDEWRLDGVQAAATASYSFDSTAVDPGKHNITLRFSVDGEIYSASFTAEVRN